MPQIDDKNLPLNRPDGNPSYLHEHDIGPNSNSGALTIEEMVDFVQQDLTFSCALPKLLPDLEVRRMIINQALPYFYEKYQFSLVKTYYLIPYNKFYTDEYTTYKSFTMPDEVQNIIWLYALENRSLFELGVNAPNLSINLGVTNQPYLSSYVTTVGQLGIYKTVIDGFSDVLNQMSKHTLKFDYNFAGRRLHMLTDMQCGGVVAECYARIPEEEVFNLDLFKRYILGLSQRQLGRMLRRYNFNLPGAVQINSDNMISDGDALIKQVEEEIKGMTTNSFFFMVKR